MTEQWQELKETITELRDNDGTSTQQEICKFLANYMDVLEKQMQEPCEDIAKAFQFGMALGFGEKHDEMDRVIDEIKKVITPQPKTGKWIKTPKAVMGDGYMWYCDKCEHQVYQDSSRDYPSEKYCPKCGAKMIQESEGLDEG